MSRFSVSKDPIFRSMVDSSPQRRTAILVFNNEQSVTIWEGDSSTEGKGAPNNLKLATLPTRSGDL